MDTLQQVFKQNRLVAFVNHGRWLVQCLCMSAEQLSPGTEWWVCSQCGNYRLDGNPVPVAWPPNWQRIEQVLSIRPDPITRNWTFSETVEDLEAENEARLRSLEN